MLAGLGILNVLLIHAQAVITRVWYSELSGLELLSLIHGSEGGWCGIFKFGGWEQSHCPSGHV